VVGNLTKLTQFWFGISTIGFHPETIPYEDKNSIHHNLLNCTNYIQFLETCSSPPPPFDMKDIFPEEFLFHVKVTPKQKSAIDDLTNIVCVEVIRLIKNTTVCSGIYNKCNIGQAFENQDLVQIMKNLHTSAFKQNGFTESIRIADSLLNHSYTDPEELIQHLETTCKSLHLYNDFSKDSQIPSYFLSSIFKHQTQLYEFLTNERQRYINLHHKDYTWEEMKSEFRRIQGFYIQLQKPSISSTKPLSSQPTTFQKQTGRKDTTIISKDPIIFSNRGFPVIPLTFTADPCPHQQSYGSFTKFGCVNCGKDHVIICCPSVCTFKHTTSPFTSPHWACSCPDMVKLYKKTQTDWWQTNRPSQPMTATLKCKSIVVANLAKIDTGANHTLLQNSKNLENLQSHIPVKTHLRER
jgi:hypothetical protein